MFKCLTPGARYQTHCYQYKQTAELQATSIAWDERINILCMSFCSYPMACEWNNIVHELFKTFPKLRSQDVEVNDAQVTEYVVVCIQSLTFPH